MSQCRCIRHVIELHWRSTRGGVDLQVYMCYDCLEHAGKLYRLPLPVKVAIGVNGFVFEDLSIAIGAKERV